MRTSNLPDAAPRLTVVDGGRLGILTYGVDNGYPQRMDNLYDASGSAKKCAKMFAKYMVGKGFENLDFYKVEINSKGLTPDKLLRLVAKDRSRSPGYAIHVNWNALFEITSVSYVPFKHCRMGEGDNKGKIGVYNDWYSADSGARRKKGEANFINRYNPDPVRILAEVEADGGWEYYKGQIFWETEVPDTYPHAYIDPVLDDVESEIESGITRKNNLKNNFQLKQIWREPGQAEAEDIEAATLKDIQDFMGPKGNQVLVVFSKDPEGKDMPTLTPIDSKIDDKIFSYTDAIARSNIYTQFGQPAILHSDYASTNGYNEGQLPQSMKYYNSYTEPDRIQLEETFREIFSHFHTPINLDDNYRIVPLDAVDNTVKIEEEDTRPLIEIIGIGGMQALQGILADTTMTPERKRDTIMIVFGLDEEKANKLAGYDPTAVAVETL